ncbi:hypothetical protein HMJ29_05570 [Hymenobacter taeanensis]|uniref:DUF6799 domain-containing protein n=1 Tax=Hymenobacter taeanensis TaxID=2735321 RepID=A0A6M6BER2_9BACT|nr:MULTISPECIES: DUF6799 domain-containing protein [Hymenobacter]QJX46432.1 hypothetical protein HMJ29_05570 [Hymenobacter taeanensis]UOQ80294.1 hypothetical protein MUN83_15885 [Hymenobacter sp. 5414T-23]
MLATGLAKAQIRNGFQRHDGTTYLIRNGEARPMTRDTHLPNGRVVTRDGFVVQRDGQRTKLPEGAGCTLLGQFATIDTEADGRLALFTGSAGRSAPNVVEPAAISQLQRWFGKPSRGKAKGHYKKGGKHKGRGKED